MTAPDDATTHLAAPDPGTLDPGTLDFARGDGLLPAIVQDADDGRVLMLGYMDRAALARTLASRCVTFYSRSRARLWTKGEQSGNVLDLVAIEADCDGDALLVQARPRGPTCHLQRTSCFASAPAPFLPRLAALVGERQQAAGDDSYTARLFASGLRRIAQKVGEEGVETALAAVAEGPQEMLAEAADLLFHLLVLLRARGLGLSDLDATLRARHPHPARTAHTRTPPK